MTGGFNLGVSGGIPVPFAVIVLAEFVVAYLFVKEKSRRMPLALIFVGGAANLWSRAVHGGVVDPLNFFGLLYNNVSDYLIFFVVVWYGYTYFRELRKLRETDNRKIRGAGNGHTHTI